MLRAIAVALTFAVVTVVLIPVQWLAVARKWPLRRSLPVAYHRMMCALLGVRIRVVGERCQETPLLIVSNHVSWLDITVLTSLAPIVFVAKRDVARWPLFGLLAKLQRSIFVDRERRARTSDATHEIARRMTDGDPVVLFGEGTSSDGNRVLPFRSSLLGAVQAALADRAGEAVFVQPLAIAYVGFGGLPAGRQHRPQLAWYGAMELMPHLLNVFRRGAIDVTVVFGEPVSCSAESDRKELARLLETSVRRMAAGARRGSLQ